MPRLEPAAPAMVITRVLDAPREVVFRAWTEAEQLERWGGPKDLAMRVVKLELQPQGACLYAMRSPGGQVLWARFSYREIVAPARLVYVNSFSNEQGELVRNPASATWPLELLNTLTFDETAGRTLLSLHCRALEATDEEHRTFEAALPFVVQGFEASFDQLRDHLAHPAP